jgi:hypothetical protein
MSLDCDDSCVEIYIKRDGKTIEGDFVSADFARQLERELTEARDRIEDLTSTGIHSCHAECGRPNCVLRRELAGVTKQRDALATALCQVLDNDGVLVRTAAREALATLEGRGE